MVICLRFWKKKKKLKQKPKTKKHNPTNQNKTKTNKTTNPQENPPKPILEYVAIINIFLWKRSPAL